MKKIFFVIFFVLSFLFFIFCKKFVVPQYPGMVYIPAGEAVIGSNESYSYEGPKQKVYLKGFLLIKLRLQTNNINDL